MGRRVEGSEGSAGSAGSAGRARSEGSEGSAGSARSAPLTRRHCDGTEEAISGYARAVRWGVTIEVSGTTCRDPLVTPDMSSQAEECLGRVVAAVEALGGTREDIVRTRMYLAPGTDWREAAAVHRSTLGDVSPANTTLFVHGLVGAGVLVEIEATAFLGRPLPAPGEGGAWSGEGGAWSGEGGAWSGEGMASDP